MNNKKIIEELSCDKQKLSEKAILIERDGMRVDREQQERRSKLIEISTEIMAIDKAINLMKKYGTE